MQRSRLSTSNPLARDEIPFTIDYQLNYNETVAKWSIRDLELFIEILAARLKAEETYVQLLGDIPKFSNKIRTEATEYFSDTMSFHQAVKAYENGVSSTISCRQELVDTMKQQITTLEKVLCKHESLKCKIKSQQGWVNSQFTAYLTKHHEKVHKTYVAKHKELEAAIADSAFAYETEPDQAAFTDDRYKSNNNWRYSKNISANQSIHLPDLPQKRGIAMLKAQMSQMRTQLTSGQIDLCKNNSKVARLKREAADADREYRKATIDLERLRKEQVAVSGKTIKRLERVLHEKTSVTKIALGSILACDHGIRTKETEWNENVSALVSQMDGNKDIELFYQQYDKNKFSPPRQVYYEHYERGQCRDLLFGVRLEDYALDHHTLVPLLVLKCVQAVESRNGLDTEGIYRISSRQSNLEALKLEFELDEKAACLDTSKYDVITATCLLKLFLREMQEPLFSFPLQERINYSNVTDINLRLHEMQIRLSRLPDAHFGTLKVIVEHIAKVNARSQFNKMNLRNLSVVFTPSIFHDHYQAENLGEYYTDKAFDDLILYHDTLFSTAKVIAESNQSILPNTGRKVSLDDRRLEQGQLNNVEGNLAQPDGQSSTFSTVAKRLIRHASLKSKRVSNPSPVSGVSRSRSLRGKPKIQSDSPITTIPIMPQQASQEMRTNPCPEPRLQPLQQPDTLQTAAVSNYSPTVPQPPPKE